MSNIVHGLKTNSQAYKIAQKVANMWINESSTRAEIWFNAECDRLKLKCWDALAISECATKLITG